MRVQNLSFGARYIKSATVLKNNKNLGWLFGVTDKDYKNLIEQQANTESNATVQPSNGKAKSLVKTNGIKGKKRPRENNK